MKYMYMKFMAMIFICKMCLSQFAYALHVHARIHSYIEAVIFVNLSVYPKATALQVCEVLVVNGLGTYCILHYTCTSSRQCSSRS